MVSVVIKSSNHRPISPTWVHWGHVVLFLSLDSFSSAMVVLIGGGMGERDIGPKSLRNLARLTIRPQNHTEQKHHQNHHVLPHRAPCYGRHRRTNYGSMYSLLSIYSMSTVVIWFEIGLRGRNSIWNVGVKNYHLSAYLTHHGRYHIITNVQMQWIHLLVLY